MYFTYLFIYLFTYKHLFIYLHICRQFPGYEAPDLRLSDLTNAYINRCNSAPAALARDASGYYFVLLFGAA